MTSYCPKRPKIADKSSIIARLDESATAGDNGVKDNIQTIKATEDSTIITNCHFFVKRKQRYCKLPCVKKQNYCCEHSFTEHENGRKRIVCPMDPKHSCYEDQLEKHLKKCNARKELRPVYFKGNINTGTSETGLENTTLNKVVIQQIPKEDLFTVIEKCKSLYKDNEAHLIKKEIAFHSCMSEAANDPQNGQPALKHITQQASLIGHMERLCILKTGHCYVEFGAGKGGLSHWVQKSFQGDKPNSRFILVDRSSVRYKMDCHHKGNDQGPMFERLKIDIQHLNLDDVPNLDHDLPIVCIGKHLCGNATDFMLRCITSTLHEKKTHSRYIKGVTLAMCCHHRCEWQSYVGKEFILKSGLTSYQFNIMCSMTSWACCGNKVIEDEGYNHPYYGNLKPQEREEIGLQVKRLIDFGRMKYLESNGFSHIELIHFVEKDCTPENVCLIATKPEVNKELVDNKQ